MQNVYVVEDDDNIREMLLYALNQKGFEAAGFGNAAAFYAALELGPSLVLLDIMLPGEDGISILKKLKAAEKTKDIPVIMLTAKGSEYDRVKGLDLGADDYITKPFSILEVIARVKAVLRRGAADSKADAALRVGGVTLREDSRAVFVQEAEVALTFKEFELLRELMRHEGLVLSRERILELVWGYEYFGESRTVDMHIKSLRQKLGAAGEMIKTVRNVGYKIDERGS